jgi:hypothetical protein
MCCKQSVFQDCQVASNSDIYYHVAVYGLKSLKFTTFLNHALNILGTLHHVIWLKKGYV